MKNPFISIANWFKEYALSFHIFNWILPAFLPIIAVSIFFWALQELGLETGQNYYLILFMNFASQLFYFSFLLLINNAALYHLYNNRKQNNHFALSIFVAILFLLAYVVATLFVLSNCSTCGKNLVGVIFIFSILTSGISIFLYSKNTEASFNIKNDESVKISEERKDKSKTLEDRIKSDD